MASAIKLLCLSQFSVERRSSYPYITGDTNPKQRRACFEYFSKMPWAHRSEPKTFHEYLDDLSRSVFVASPPGNGLDCHRTWEALYLGCYPIVLSSTLDSLYEGLPVVVVHAWEEATEEFLEKKRREFQKRDWNLNKLYMPYWFEKVTHLQEKLKTSV